jgi:branched-chain amino acid transport system permease protein
MQAIVSGLVLGGLYALLALAFVLTYQATKTLNFALGEFVTAAGFLVVALAADLPGWLSLVLAVLLVGLLGAGVERLVVRPFNAGVHDIRWLLTTAGLSLVMLDLLRNSQGGGTVAVGVGEIAGFVDVLDARVSTQSLLILALAVLLTVLLAWFTQRTRAGSVFRAVAEDRQTAALMGLNPGLVALGSYAAAMAVAALAGILWSVEVGLSIAVGPSLLVAGFAAAILGGLDSLLGALLGGLLYGLVTVVATYHVGTTFGGIIGLLLVVGLLAVRPQGLLGRAVRVKV